MYALNANVLQYGCSRHIGVPDQYLSWNITGEFSICLWNISPFAVLESAYQSSKQDCDKSADILRLAASSETLSASGSMPCSAIGKKCPARSCWNLWPFKLSRFVHTYTHTHIYMLYNRHLGKNTKKCAFEKFMFLNKFSLNKRNCSTLGIFPLGAFWNQNSERQKWAQIPRK